MKRFCCLLLFAFCFAALAVRADVKSYDLDQAVALPVVQDGDDSYCQLQTGVYVVKASTNLTASGGSRPCIQVVENAEVVLYIPKGVDLTLEQRNSGYAVAHYPSIVVPYNATLIIVGEGTIHAQGGDGSNGCSGSDGDGMKGGSGGRGGVCTSPAIGGISGYGGYGGSGGDANASDAVEGGHRGSSGSSGGNGSSMGVLYVLGPVTLNLTDGEFDDDSPSGGNCGAAWYEDGGALGSDTCEGGGAGGGAGGDGSQLNYNIGGGGPGAGGGGGGGNGRHDYGYKQSNMHIWHGANGTGITSNGNVGQNVDGGYHTDRIGVQNNMTYGSASSSHEANHTGGSVGSYGDPGFFLHTDLIAGNPSYQSADNETALSKSEFEDEAKAEANLSGLILKKITFYDNYSQASKHLVIKENYFCFGLEWYIDAVDPLQKEGETFLGFYDADGHQVYDQDGKLVTDADKNPYLVNGAKNPHFGSHKDIALYPRWDFTKQVMAKHIIASLNLPEGDKDEYDESKGARVLSEVIAVELIEGDSKKVTFKAGGTIDKIKDQLKHTDVQGNHDDVEVTVDVHTDESKVWATYYYRYQKNALSWKWSQGEQTGDIEDEVISTITNKNLYTPAGDVRYNTLLQAPLFAGDKGYKFDHWIMDGKTEGTGESLPIQYADGKDHVFTACFVPRQYYIKTLIDGRTPQNQHGHIEGLDNDKLYDYGTTQTFSVVSDDCYQVLQVMAYSYITSNQGKTILFQGRKIDPDSHGNYSITVPNEDTYIEASYVPIEYSVGEMQSSDKYYITLMKNDEPVVYVNKSQPASWCYPFDDGQDVSTLRYTLEDNLILQIFPNPAYNTEKQTLSVALDLSADGKDVPTSTAVRMPNELTDYKMQRLFVADSIPGSLQVNLQEQMLDNHAVEIVQYKDRAVRQPLPIEEGFHDNIAYEEGKQYILAAKGEVVMVRLPQEYDGEMVAASHKEHVSATMDDVYADMLYSFEGEQGKYYCFQMPDYDMEIVVGKRYNGGEPLEQHRVLNRTEGYYSLYAPTAAHYSSWVPFQLASIDPINFPLTPQPVKVFEAFTGHEVPVVDYDPATGQGKFTMQNDDLLVTAVAPSELATAQKSVSNNSYHLRLFSAEQPYYVPQNVKVFHIKGTMRTDAESCNMLASAQASVNTESTSDDYQVLRLKQDPAGYIPAHTAVLLYSKEDEIRLLPTSTRLSEVPSTLLTKNLSKVTLGARLAELDEDGSKGYNAAYCLMELRDGVALILVDDLDVELEAGTGFIPVHVEGHQVSSQAGALDLALYILRNDNGETTAVETPAANVQQRNTQSGVYSLSGLRMSDGLGKLPQGIYIIGGKKVKK